MVAEKTARGTMAPDIISRTISRMLPTAMAVGNILLIVLLMMSGAMVPRAVFSATIQRISDFSPLTQFVTLLRGLWNGEPWGSLWVPVVVLGVMLVVCTGVATKLFRWEPSGTS